MSEIKHHDRVKTPPFETDQLRKRLSLFLNTPYQGDPEKKVGNFKWGVYAFFDYDGEPIYVGQTNEMLRTRIRRHLTNQRTDAVAMSVLDPFEVFEVCVWPLPEFQGVGKNSPEFAAARARLDALEKLIYDQAIKKSHFGAILNEKEPPNSEVEIEEPIHVRGQIVSEEVRAIRAHPDFRIARRAMVISRLAQVISERQVAVGLRRVLKTQAMRLSWLADRRFTATSR